MQLTKNFNSKEFDSPDLAHSGQKMKMPFMRKLQYAREIAKTSFVITSGYRTVAHNKAVGGKSDSSHLFALACDISCTDSRERALILKGLIIAGFTRIGIGKTIIHVDLDSEKYSNVFWLY